jgi:hypothetical protein
MLILDGHRMVLETNWFGLHIVRHVPETAGVM